MNSPSHPRPQRILRVLAAITIASSLGCQAAQPPLATAPASPPQVSSSSKNQAAPATSSAAIPTAPKPDAAADASPVFRGHKLQVALFARDAEAVPDGRMAQLFYESEPFHLVEIVCSPRGDNKATCRNVGGLLPKHGCGRGTRHAASAKLLKALGDKPPVYQHEMLAHLSDQPPDRVLTHYIVRGHFIRSTMRTTEVGNGLSIPVSPTTFKRKKSAMVYNNWRRKSYAGVAQTALLATFYEPTEFMFLSAGIHDGYRRAHDAVLKNRGVVKGVSEGEVLFENLIANTDNPAVLLAAAINVATLRARRAGSGQTDLAGFATAVERAQRLLNDSKLDHAARAPFEKPVAALMTAHTKLSTGHFQFGHPAIEACAAKDHPLRPKWSPPARSPSRSPRRVRIVWARVKGPLPKAAVHRVIYSNLKRLDYCNKQSFSGPGRVQNGANRTRRVRVKFVIRANGTVSNASVTGDSAIRSCVTRAFRRLSFPKSNDGVVNAIYLLELRPR